MIKSSLKWLLDESIKPMLMALAGSLYIIFAVIIMLGPIMGIGYLVDHSGSDWYLLLFIPWLFISPLTVKPLAVLFE